ncbi:MAG: rhomboid family intramembrane serine protease [Myxococcota bacterium]
MWRFASRGAGALDRWLGPGEGLAALVVVVHLASGASGVVRGASPASAFLFARSLVLRVAVGGQYAPLVAHDPWRLATCVLLHVDALHLALNAVALLALGRALEPVVGRFRVLAGFCLAGVGGATFTHLVGTRQSDGASGGAYGLLAAGVVLAVVRRRSLEPRDRRLLGPVFGGFLALNLVASLVVPSIDVFAHLGGAVVGAAWAAVPESAGLRAAEALWVGLFVGGCVYGWTIG